MATCHKKEEFLMKKIIAFVTMLTLGVLAVGCTAKNTEEVVGPTEETVIETVLEETTEETTEEITTEETTTEETTEETAEETSETVEDTTEETVAEETTTAPLE
jgi:hypothetical protein